MINEKLCLGYLVDWLIEEITYTKVEYKNDVGKRNHT